MSDNSEGKLEMMIRRTPWYAALGGLIGAIIGALLVCLLHRYCGIR